MLNKDDLKKVLGFLYDGAMAALNKDGSVAPFAFIATEQKFSEPKIALGAVPLDFTSDTSKERSLQIVKKLARDSYAVGVFFVTEGWIAKVKGAEYDGIRPSKRADKEEAVIISGNTPITSAMISQIFTKEGDKIVLGEKTEHYDGKLENNLVSGIWETTC